MESTFDVSVTRAMYCSDCDTVGNGVDRCPRCQGSLVPLAAWFTPLPVPSPPISEMSYRLRRGVEDSDPVDGIGYVLKAEAPFGDSQFASEADALDMLQSFMFGAEGQAMPNSMYARLPGVCQVYWIFGQFWAVVKIS